MRPKPAGTASMVTSHAVLRLLELAEGRGLRSCVEALILADGRAELIQQVGNGLIRIAGTHTALVIRNACVVDVILENGRG
jgi:hypothetical protein